MYYTLTAKLHGETARVRFAAIDDTDATYEAIGLIMAAAYPAPRGPWGRGEIVLTSPTGAVLQTMPAK